MITAQNLTFSYGKNTVLKDVSFDVKGGEFAAVLGTNGAGKSTLLKCLDGILKADGKIALDGQDLKNLSRAELAQTVGYVPQKLSFAHTSVFDAVLMGRLPYIKWEASARDLDIVGEMLDTLSLSHLATRDVCTLSGGEMQKVAVARALVQQPKILLFDEPTCNLDPKNSLDTLKIINGVAKNGIAVVVTLHDVNLALRFADKFVFLKGGALYRVCDKNGVTREVIRDVYGIDAEICTIRGKTVVVPV